jgi:hypothetical protein
MGQTAGAPSLASKSVNISAVTTTTNAIMGASRMRAATIKVDAQFRTLLIAPSQIPSPVSQCRSNVNGWLTEPNYRSGSTRFSQTRNTVRSGSVPGCWS